MILKETHEHIHMFAVNLSGQNLCVKTHNYVFFSDEENNDLPERIFSSISRK
jgi:hypothetical protein